MKKTLRIIYIILIGLLSVTCARPTPWRVVKYTAAGDPIKLVSLVEGGEASWSGDGSWIAYVDSGIWITDPQAEKQIQLTQSGHAPSWSADGKKLAYADSGIWILELAGRNKNQLTTEGHDPCWSADGQHIIYANNGIWKISIDGGDPEQLMPAGMDPACSPVDDRILVEIFNPERLEFDIWESSPNQKPRLIAANAESPAWSANGKYILYCASGVWVTTVDNSQTQRLTAYGYQPSWSPDGSSILLSFNGQVWLMDSPYND